MGELLLHPLLPFAVGAVIVWFAPRRVGSAVMLLAPAVALVQLALLPAETSVTATYLGFDVEVLRVDGLAMAFGWVFAVAAGIAGTFGLATMGAHERTAALAYVGAALGVVFAGDLLTLFVFWEIKAVASTFVILARRGGNGSRAGFRYLFFHLVGGKLLLAGALWHYASTGSLAFEALALTGPTTLILIALLLSAAVPPLHAWLADAYPEASVAGTVFLSAFTTKAAVYTLVRGFPGTDLLIYLGIVMAAYGVTYAMLQNDTRRLLSYHIISQVGFMVTAVGIGTDLALNGAVAHAVAHIIYKGLLLMGVGALLHATGWSKISEMGGLAARTRAILVLYLIGAVSISSVPLFSGFVSKEIVVSAASGAGLTWLVLALKVVSVGTFLSTGLKLPYTTWFGAQGPGPQTNEDARIEVRPVPASMYVAMGVAAAINIGLGLIPAPLYELLPYPLEYTPYSLGKVVEKLQLLGFTVLGFWLLRDKVTAARKIVLDLDWLYRVLPGRLAAAWRAWRDRRAVSLRPETAGAVLPGGPGAHGAADTGQDAATHAEPGDHARTDAPGAVPVGVLAATATSAPPAVRPTTPLRAALAPAAALLDRVRTALTPVDAPAPVVPTWLLGAVLLAGAIVVLLVSLVAGGAG